MSQRYNDNIKSSKPQDRDLKNVKILPETLAEDLGSRRECCWHYVVSAFENITKKGCSWSIVVTWLRSVSTLHAFTSILEIH